MGLVKVLLIAYFTIGIFMALRHLSSGRVGAAGPLWSFLGLTVSWPLLFIWRVR